MLFGSRERVAVIGGGAAGLGAAWRLSEKYDVTIYEASAELGGHAYSYPFGATGKRVDMGVMITLPWAYPNLYCMFERFGVRTQSAAAELLVSFTGSSTGEEAWGTDAGMRETTFFKRIEAQASRFELMMFEIAALPFEEQLAPLSYFLEGRVAGVPHSGLYDPEFIQKGLCPLLSLFLVTRESLVKTPAWSLSMMFRYGTLSFFSPTTWRTIVGGTSSYISRLTRSFRARFLLSTGVKAIARSSKGVTVTDEKGGEELYDQVVLATGAATALTLLAAPSDEERRLLSSFHYQPAHVYLHQDSSLLSERFKATTFFQYRSVATLTGRDDVVTYNMKHAAGLDDVAEPILVSVFSQPPSLPLEKTLTTKDFSHLIPDDDAMRARLDLHTIQGRQRTWFCGDYTTFSSHEDAFTSGMIIAEALGVPYPFRYHPAASARYTQNRLLMLPPLGWGTRVGLAARLELLRDSLDVILPAASNRLFPRPSRTER